MPIKIFDTGRNNSFEIGEKIKQSGTATIKVSGNNNVIKIDDTNYNFDAYITMTHNCKLEIARGINCFNLVIYQSDNTALRIGNTVGFNGLVKISLHEPSGITIGDGCLFADQVEVMTSDMHSIVDATTKLRLNPAKDISLGDRVWVGNRSLIMKGAKIGSGAVIGAMSTVSREIPENCVAAGSPARVVRQNATWDFRLL